MQTKTGDGGRNYGVDLFRIVSMLMVVTLHVLNRGGAFNASANTGGERQTAWLIETICYGSVDCYALISGYVCYGRKHKYSRALYVWLEVLFYTLLAALFFIGTGRWEMTGEALSYSISPIFHNHYWYITSYIGMTLFIPFLNRAAQSVSGRDAAIFTGASVVLFMLVPCAFGTPVFALSNGYSMIWLMILYMIGAFIKRFRIGERVPVWALALLYVAFTCLTWAGCVWFSASWLLNYISPTVFVSSALLLIIFSRMKIRAKVPVWLIKTFAPATLGVYIIHVNYFIWRLYIYNFATKFGGGGVLRFVGLVFASAIVIYIAGSLIDVCRIKLFELCGVRRALDALDRAVDKLGTREPEPKD